MTDQIHDNFFKKVFSDVEHVRDFFRVALPTDIQDSLDFDHLTIDPTSYVSETIKGYFCDIVVKTHLQDSDIPADVYILLEHKSYHDKAVLVQLLHYMYLMWQKDTDEHKPLRVIIPLVFYHGKQKWDVPLQFIDQFKVNQALKKYLLNFQYLLFDATTQDFEDNPILQNNVFLLTALLLMRSVYEHDLSTIRKVFEFWSEKGFMGKTNAFLFFCTYLFETKENETITEFLKESERNDIMTTFAQKWLQEGLEKGLEKGEQRGKMEGKIEGRTEGKIEALQQSVLDAIEVKFNKVPKKLKIQISTLQDEHKLREIHRSVIRADSLENILL